MIENIRKRDGRLVPFELDKIAGAIYKSFEATSDKYELKTAIKIAKIVENKLEMKKSALPTVELVQDTVEEVLIEQGYVRVAKAYILYRANRTRERDMRSRLMKTFEEITFADSKDSDLKRENANVNADAPMGTMLKYGAEAAKQFNEMFVLNPKHARAHINGDIHIHDMDFLTLTTTCCQIDIVKLFKNGFSTGHGVLREPNSISVYAALACIAIQSNQNDQHGGQAIPNFDYGMAPGVAKSYIKHFYYNLSRAVTLLTKLDGDEVVSRIKEKMCLKPTLDFNENFNQKLKEILVKNNINQFVDEIIDFATSSAYKETDKETYQAMEAFIHNLNTMHSRAGAQVPFSSINYGMDVSSEGRMVVRNILLATEAGLGHGETPIFPIQIFRVKEGINYNEGELNYDLFKLACKTSAKRLFPNFSFVDAPFNLQYYKGTPETEIAYMGCRTRVMANICDKDNEISFGRGNLSFTSINLPRLAIRSNGDVNEFFDKLDKMLDLCIAQLLERFEIQCRRKVKNYPFLMGQGIWLDSDNLKPDDEVREVLKHGTLTVGFIGLAETLKALIGVHHGESENAQILGLQIIEHMSKAMEMASEKYQLNFSLIATPAEGLSGRFVKMDKKLFGELEGITDRDYYTNSFHIPVYYPISAFKKIQLEGPYHALTNGGHISYVEMDGDPTKNLAAFEKVVRAMHDNGIGYGAINHPVDRDPVCGYNGIIDDVCPLCGRTEEEHHGFERIRRITGYLVGTLDRFNDGKKAEEHDRVKHGIE
ncbi:anaerobic ribonucleoside-triphosphate reductase [Thomasclavelia cocleata]|uniref:Ribonucleoside-triphosphate reductase class III catalytic subunit n=1 Tax=Thomasclavelia cocleata TaxID=69824 RepID=A0A1I0DSD5_9FIRM|nr:anaerobic ribonucleoside triphosphate reductase [Thomasclavelia cocleata]MCR1960056.1 anaerobic ribonucleoside triphosphate reductase [Thomasclavelia cocleata]NDO42966.1 anaerobic ribonucleoside triphosphate reductase [Thomasclavelia cocleata]PJN79558.1 anaerobic ribonucleoside-triphosphate reductase [Thomasclavelia cocleata]SET34674.1 ribonucleoside-triphosphate reductase class III catalytic subunit [Thomasclavelia cocleata]